MLLAGGLGLIWFVEFQEGGLAEEAPMWSMALVLGVRLLADFVGAWIVISVLRLAFVFGKFALMRFRTGFEVGTQ
jgi:hypothetical protein